MTGDHVEIASSSVRIASAMIPSGNTELTHTHVAASSRYTGRRRPRNWDSSSSRHCWSTFRPYVPATIGTLRPTSDPSRHWTMRVTPWRRSGLPSSRSPSPRLSYGSSGSSVSQVSAAASPSTSQMGISDLPTDTAHRWCFAKSRPLCAP